MVGNSVEVKHTGFGIQIMLQSMPLVIPGGTWKKVVSECLRNNCVRDVTSAQETSAAVTSIIILTTIAILGSLLTTLF